MAFTFTKMHGLGNDYIYVNLFEESIDDAPSVAQAVSDRHLGVGGDGMILIAPPDNTDAQVRMIMYNADGSRAQMCGNGVRCVAKYTYDHGISTANPLKVQTDAGVLTLELTLGDDGKVAQVRVDMGEPILEPQRIPVALEGDRVVKMPIEIKGHKFDMTCVSMGNPHVVIYVDDLAEVPLGVWGPALENHPLFPERINVHFAQVTSRDYVNMITWERGAGPTQACGTGACAVAVASILNGKTDRTITTKLPGGELAIELNESTNHVFMTGPATEVFTGVWPE